MSELTTETLRAELGQLELRIVDRLANDLKSKADASALAALSETVRKLGEAKADKEDLEDVNKKVDDVNGRLLAWALTIVGSLIVAAATFVLTTGGHP